MTSRSHLKTLSYHDRDFRAYLLGTFSNTERAIPIRTLNVNSESEQVTFKVVPIDELPHVHFIRKWAEVFKLRSFILVGFPVFGLLVKNALDEIEMDPILVTTAVLSAFSILVGFNLLNDYFDHMRGLDRIHPDQQHKPIQKGWVTAMATRKWAVFYLFMGACLAVPTLYFEPSLVVYVALPTFFLLLAWLTRQRGARFRRGAEFMIFLLAGPLLTMGFQHAVTGRVDPESFWFGCLNGWFAVFLIHLKNFECLLVNAQAGLQSTVVRLGFDRSRVLMAVWWALYILNFLTFHYVYAAPEWFWASMVILPLISWPFFRSLYRLTSPVGSEMSRLAKLGREVAIGTLTWFVVEHLWIFLVVEIGAPR